MSTRSALAQMLMLQLAHASMAYAALWRSL